MNNVALQISQDIKKFEEYNDLQALEAASDTINSMHASKGIQPSALEAFHAEKLALWLQILNAIDAKLDAKFDFNDTPELSVTPPPGVQVPPGADPNNIKDAKMRQKYIDAIKLNQNKNARYSFQYELAKLNDQISSDAKIYIAKSHLKLPESKEKFLQAVDQLSTSPQRKISLRILAQ
jgi:hypothetical protein